MYYKITELTSSYKETHGNGFNTIADAEAYIERRFGHIVSIEQDVDNPDYYDLFTSYGRVLAIEPIHDEQAAWYDTSAELT